MPRNSAAMLGARGGSIVAPATLGLAKSFDPKTVALMLIRPVILGVAPAVKMSKSIQSGIDRFSDGNGLAITELAGGDTDCIRSVRHGTPVWMKPSSAGD